MKDHENVGETIRLLPTMKRAQLVALWEKSFGRTPARKLRPELMRPVLAFRVQELAYGGHSPETKQRLKQIAKSAHPEGRFADEALNRFRAGTKIVREWGGKTYEVVISTNGYGFEGKTYKSLSPIASLITGTRWSGPAFFGTKRAGAGK